MKKLLAVLAALLMALTPALGAIAEEATVLPLGVDFTMDFAAARKALGDGADADDWGDDTGMLLKNDVELGSVALTADIVNLQIDRNNSAQAPRLSIMSFELPVGDSCVAAFRAALAAVTAAYGEPDGDPFDAYAVEAYKEFGSLSATWTKPDVRISLSMGRMYSETLMLDFTNRLCYDENDLK